MPVINGVYLKDFTALPGSVADANIIPIAITGDNVAYRTTVAGIVTDARITAKLLTGLSVTGGAVVAADTILEAFGKVQNQINGKQGTITLTTTGTSGAATLVSDTLNIPNYADGGVLSLSAIGGTANANAATITGTVLNLQPADASFGGVVTTGTQTFAGAKTLSSALASTFVGQFLENTGASTDAKFIRISNTTGDASFGIEGSTPTQISSADGGIAYATVLKSVGSNSLILGTLSKAALTINTSQQVTLSQNITGTTAVFSSTLALGGALSGTTANFTGQLTLGSTITNGTYTYTLPSATGTLALTSDIHSAVTLAAIGSTANANGATLTGQVLNLQPASASFGGVVTTGTQTFAGAKTFSVDLLVNNLTVGTGAGNISSNTAIGYEAFFTGNITGTNNTAVGAAALRINSTNNCTAVGSNALTVSTTGGSTAIGSYALQNVTTGGGNTAIGVDSGKGITTGTGNTILGVTGTALAAGLTNNIILSIGTGAIKAQFDGTNWTLTGGTTITGVLTLNSTISNGTYTYTLPSATGTLALTSALSSYLLLTGGTLTGALSGTSATFSSTATATAFIPSGATVPTNGMYLSAANTLNFATNTTNRLSISSAGAATFVGTLTATSVNVVYNNAIANSTTDGVTLATYTTGASNELLQLAISLTNNNTTTQVRCTINYTTDNNNAVSLGVIATTPLNAYGEGQDSVVLNVKNATTITVVLLATAGPINWSSRIAITKIL